VSVAFEASLLLPTGGIGTQPGLGMTGIVSRKWSNAALHINGAAILDQEGRWSPASGVILEGPQRWPIRPVGELTVDGVRDRTIGTLFGEYCTGCGLANEQCEWLTRTRGPGRFHLGVSKSPHCARTSRNRLAIARLAGIESGWAQNWAQLISVPQIQCRKLLV
jgi:hypothetical protein